MANQLQLPRQKFNYKEITDQFPATGNPKKKVFFQAQLRSLANGDATFGIVAYASWKDKEKWVVSSKPIAGTDVGSTVSIPLSSPVSFANNEVVVSMKLKKKKKRKVAKKGEWNQLEKMLCKLANNKKQLAKATLLFETCISENPHLEYNVTLEVNGTMLSVATKPCPPASPEF